MVSLESQNLRGGFQNAGVACRGEAVAGELRSDFVCAQRHQIHRRRADEGSDEGVAGF